MKIVTIARKRRPLMSIALRRPGDDMPGGHHLLDARQQFYIKERDKIESHNLMQEIFKLLHDQHNVHGDRVPRRGRVRQPWGSARRRPAAPYRTPAASAGVLRRSRSRGVPALDGEELHGVEALSWLNHGPYHMKGVEEPLEICKARLRQPLDSEKAHRFISADSEPVLGWRPAIDQAVPGSGWVLEVKLGEGGFGKVWLGRDKNKRLKTERVFKFCFRADRVRSLKREATLFGTSAC
jgi:hypothetical protein